MDYDFSKVAVMKEIWREMVVSSPRLFFHPGIPFIGFSLVKRYKGNFRLTLWLSTFKKSLVSQVKALLPRLLQSRKFQYRPNSQRIIKHCPLFDSNAAWKKK